MDARYLTLEQRQQLRRLLIRSRDELAVLRKRMKGRGWFTDDTMLLCVESAYAALHGAVQCVPKDDVPVVVPEPPKSGCALGGPQVGTTGAAPEVYPKDLRRRRKSA